MHAMRSLPLFLILFYVCACGKTETPPATAPATRPAPNTPRIISAVPAATLNLILIGAVDSLVGVSTFDALYLPEDKKNLPTVGDYNLEKLNYENLLALQPTALIVQTAEAHIPARLRDLAKSQHFDIINIKLDTTDDLWNTVRALGKAAKKEDAADTAILKAQAELKEIAKSYEGKPRPKVVYVFSHNPLSVVGSNNFMDEMLTLAGGDNVGARVGKSFITVSNETLIQLAPDVLLIGAPSQPDQQAVDDPRIEPWLRYDIPAVKNHRVFLVTDPDALTASVNLPKSVRSLSNLIHKFAAEAPATAPAPPPPQATKPAEGKNP
jgi:iron complex transport system substrate-binding protein